MFELLTPDLPYQLCYQINIIFDVTFEMAVKQKNKTTKQVN